MAEQVAHTWASGTPRSTSVLMPQVVPVQVDVAKPLQGLTSLVAEDRYIVSLVLAFASPCGGLSNRAFRSVETTGFAPSPCAGPCCALLAPVAQKGQEKDNSVSAARGKPIANATQIQRELRA